MDLALFPERTLCPTSSREERLAARAGRTLTALGDLLDRADRRAPVSARSRRLCAALGVLAEDAYVALGGTTRVEAVGHAAALLSLLTKVDDEVIDGKAFHGGPLRPDGDTELQERTRRYLAPTLASIRLARPVAAEPRCELAAMVGAALRELAPEGPRLSRLLEVIAIGWEVQVRAVSVLSSHPRRTPAGAVARVTAEISGYWLLMITMIGALPQQTRRGLTAAEERAFLRWGWFIQRADALSDFGKDLDAGLANSWAGYMLWTREPAAYEAACRAGDAATLYRRLRATGADRTCLARPGQLDGPAAALRELGGVPDWLGFIHAFLLQRYQEVA